MEANVGKGSANRGWSKKRWIKAVVLAVGVADCAGIYYAGHQLDHSVPDDVRYDRTAYAVPERLNQFHAGDTAMFADAQAPLAPAAADRASALPVAPAPAPQMAVADGAAPRAATRAAAPVLQLGAARSAAANRPALALVAPSIAPVHAPAGYSASGRVAPAPVLAEPKLAAESPRGSAMSRFLSSIRSATGTSPAKATHAAVNAPARLARVTPVAPVAKPAAVITPHLARVEQPAPVFHAEPSRLTRHDQTAAFAMAPVRGGANAAPANAVGKTASTTLAKTLAHAPHGASLSSFASLVPAQRESATFAAAFANLDVPIQSSTPLELNAGHAPTPAETGLASGSALENVIPVAPAELPPVSASADEANAKL
jgi:hypothetical protein